VDFRLVAATNKDLGKLVETGGFREDLYYRLSEVQLHVPPLRERPEDGPLIAEAFLESWTAEQGLGRVRLAPKAYDAIRAHTWPGNVRELQNRLKRAAIGAAGTITPADLELGDGARQSTGGETPLPSLREARRSAEMHVIQDALRKAGGNISETARLLGVSRPKLYQLLSDYNLR